MKLKLLITNLLILCAISSNAFAQDVIVLKTGDEIKATVSEVAIDVIKYKKFENLEGPDYTIKKSDVFMIKYANGTKDVFNTQAETPAALAGTEAQTFTDARDGKIYKTVTIGSQTWMAENLNYSIDFSWCNGNSAAICNGYGRLYTWETAKEVCPSGWHLPSKSEFDALLTNLGGSGPNAYHALKEGGSSGFNALLGGWRNNKGQFGDLGKYGHWWCSTDYKTRVGWSLGMIPPLEVSHMRNTYKDWGFSVRCVKD